ncbi:MAG: Ypar14, super integron cassette [Saccharospirillaceae bacterium]|nr:Ypar14, super integron cassette [Saccharospirillaceae bacterium]
MLTWDETDVLTVLEVLPEIENNGIYHIYSVIKDNIELKIFIYQYDGDVRIEMNNLSNNESIFNMQVFDCKGIVRVNDTTGEHLEFAPAKCIEGGYDGISSIPFGVRVKVNPTIKVSLFG